MAENQDTNWTRLFQAERIAQGSEIEYGLSGGALSEYRRMLVEQRRSCVDRNHYADGRHLYERL